MKKTYSDVIERMKKMSKVTTDVELAELLGVKKSSISAYKDRGIPKDKLALFSQKYQVSLTWLEEGKGEAPDFAKLEENPTAYEDEETIRLEQFNVVASCGSGKINDLVEVVSAIEYHQSHFRDLFRGLNPNDIKIITSNGDSMSPTIESRELLFVNIKVNSFEGDGIYVFTYGETLHIKRLQMAGDVLRVISDNTNYPMWEIKEENFDRLHIHARVLVGQSQQLKLFG